MMPTLLKSGLSGYDVKRRLCGFQCEYLLQNPLFLCGKKIWWHKTPMRKNEPNLDCWEMGGGVYSKACWLIAY